MAWPRSSLLPKAPPPPRAAEGPSPPAHQLSAGRRVLKDETDEALARSSVSGDPRAFEELVTRYQRMVYTLTLRMVGNGEDARELTQVSFIKAWRGLGRFDSRRRFFSWLYRIAVHECLNFRRQRRRFEAMETEPESPGRGPAEQAEELETEAQVQQALNRVGERDRQILVLRHFLDLSYEAIGEALRVPPKTVKSRLYVARQRLRIELERIGVEGS